MAENPAKTQAAAAAAKPVKTPMTMTDGRVVEFGTKQKLVKTSDLANGTVQLDFRNGETRLFTIPESLVKNFAIHGAEQKLGDAIAGETDVGDAVASVDDLIKRLSAGEWNVTRAAGAFTGTSILIQALVEASGKTVEAIKAWLENKTQAEKLALRKSDKLAPIVAKLEAAKAKTTKSTVDTAALFGDLDGLGEVAATPAPAPSNTTSAAKTPAKSK